MSDRRDEQYTSSHRAPQTFKTSKSTARSNLHSNSHSCFGSNSQMWMVAGCCWDMAVDPAGGRRPRN